MDDMKKSIIISTVIALLVVGVILVFANIEEDKKIRKNFILAQDAFAKSQLQASLDLLDAEPPKAIANDFYVLKINVLFNMSSFYEAKEIAEKLLKLNPEDAFNNYLTSLIYLNLSDTQKTLEYLENSVKYDKNNSDYKLHLASTYGLNLDYEKAIEIYEDVLKQDEENEIARSSIATIFENQKKYKDALKYRKSAAQKFAQSVYHQYMLANLYELMNDKKNAALYFEKSARLDNNGVTDSKDRYNKVANKPLHLGKSNEEKIPILFANNLMIVSAEVNGQKGNFLLDTGANSSVIYKRFVDKNKIKISTNVFGIVEVADGKIQSLPAIRTDFKLGSIVFSAVRTFIVPNINTVKVDGIIGNDILSKVNFYIDNKNEILVINK